MNTVSEINQYLPEEEEEKPTVGLTLNEVISIIEDCDSEIASILKTNSEDEGLLKTYEYLNTSEPDTFEELLKVYKLTCCFYLLRDSDEFISRKAQLLSKTFSINLHRWDICPIHIHIICKNLLTCLKNKSNLIYFARRICSISKHTLYISISLIWTCFFQIIKKTEVKIHRMHKITILLDEVETLPNTVFLNNLHFTYTLMRIISFLQNVVILRKSVKDNSKTFQPYFKVTKNDIHRLKQLCTRIALIFEMNRKSDEKYYPIIELINLTILPGL